MSKLLHWAISGVAAIAIALAFVPAASAADNFDEAETLLFNGPAATDISSFTVSTDPVEANTTIPPTPCASAMARTDWLVIEGTGTVITVRTTGSTVDTVLAIHAFDDANVLQQLACDDDSGGSLTSALSFASTAGVPYFIQTGVFCGDAPSCANAPTGTIVVTATNADAPANDLRANATDFPLNSETALSNAAATVEPGETLECPDQGPDHNITRSFGKTLWFRIALPRRGSLLVRTGSPDADSVIALYPAGGASRIACNDDASVTNLQSVLRLDLPAGDYRLQLGGYNPGEFAGFGTPGTFPIAVDFTPNFDLDGDGVLGAAGGGADCNDENAAIRPGAADPPNDGVDQNCDGHDPKDADRDGALLPPDGGDCNDANAAIRPGAPEIESNGVDENCDGLKAFGHVNSGIQYLFDRIGCHGGSCRGVRMTRYFVRAIPAGATVTLRCTGGGCPFSVKRSVIEQATSKLSRLAFFKHRVLKRGVVLRLTVAAPFEVGTVKTQVVGKRNISTPKTECLPPGATKPQKCK